MVNLAAFKEMHLPIYFSLHGQITVLYDAESGWELEHDMELGNAGF